MIIHHLKKEEFCSMLILSFKAIPDNQISFGDALVYG
jgi:hypothetical protein